MITEEQKEKYINEYLETYSVSELLRRYYESDNICRNELVKILKAADVYEGLNGPNFLKKKAENHKQYMIETYGVENYGQLPGCGWDQLNKVPYTKFNFFEEGLKDYKKKVIKLQKKYLNECKRNNLIPDYCEYTGILFADSEFNSVNPNDPRKRTIDHKVPIIYCFFNNISPEDCSTPDNMAFVLRYINSIKGNTLHESFIPIAAKVRKALINEGYPSN